MALIRGTNSGDILFGDVTNDIIFGYDGADVIYGRAGTDWIYGGDGDDQLDGGYDNDLLAGGAHNDWLWGSGGNDVLYGEAGLDHLYGEGNDDQLYAGDDADSLDGGSGYDTLYGDDGNDQIVGGADSDELHGGFGADTMEGGSGSDAYWVDDAGDLVLENSSNYVDRVFSEIDYTLPANVEDLTLEGSAEVGIGNDLGNWLTGNASSNLLAGGDGGDALNGRGGADVMIGGRGSDLYWVDNAGDLVAEFAGQGDTDEVNSSIDYTLTANVENLHLIWGASAARNGTGNGLDNEITGNDLDNTLSGAGGNDTLDGSYGSDTLIGGRNDDTYWVGPGEVVTELAGEGTDLVLAVIDYTLGPNVENLQLIFSAAALVGTGNELNNTIRGHEFNNTLSGCGGDDRLIGYQGADTMSGGSGADTFVFATVQETSDPRTMLHDDIIDFSHAEGDRIDVAAIDANGLLAGDQAFSFIGSGAFTGMAGQLRFAGGFVQGDLNGDATADFMIHANALSLAAGDFVL